MDDKLPRIRDLTPDDRIWRLDWFGDVAYLHGKWQSNQPRITVALSPLRCAPDDHECLVTPGCTDHQTSYETRVPISALPLLRIGDLWQHGRRIASPEYTMEHFANVRVGEETANIIKSGLSSDDTFYLPLSAHPWHRRHTQSYCAMVSLEPDARMIVPSLELIRFYFGSTGNLVQRLFTAPLSSERLWTNKRFSHSKRHLHLTLAAGLSGVSASDIGRIARDKAAWRSAARIYASCQKASAQREPIYPYTSFPFTGRTDLSVAGIWLPFGNQPNATFLVYRLLSCSHAFPFKSMSYEAADRKVQSQRPSWKAGQSKRYSSATRPRSTETANVDPGDNATQKQTLFKVDHRFPDLAGKRIWRNKIEIEQAIDAYGKAGQTSGAAQSFGEPSGSQPVASLDAVQPTIDTEPAVPEFVIQGIDLIRQNPAQTPAGATINLVSPKDTQTLIFSLPTPISTSGIPRPEVLYTEPDRSVRARRGCYVEVRSPDGNSHDLLILEGRSPSDPSEVKTTRRRSVTAADFAMHDGSWSYQEARKPNLVIHHGRNEFN